MNVKDRVKSPTPGFFKVLRNVGLVLGSIGGAIVSLPLELPSIIGTIGSALAIFGGSVSGVSQMTVADEKPKEKVPENGSQ